MASDNAPKTSAAKPSLTPVLTDAASRRELIRAKAVSALEGVFPLKAGANNVIEISNVKVHTRDFGTGDHKQALMAGQSLVEPVKGTLTLKSPEGKTLEQVKNFNLLHLPYFTDRHTFVLDGNEYNVAHQLRLKPGIYTRRRDNAELEAAFNLSKGHNFRVGLDALNGLPYLEYGTSSVPLYPVLRKLGISDKELESHWGHGVVDTNAKEFSPAKHDAHVSKLYDKLIHPAQRTAATPEARLEAVRNAYANTSMDPDVTHATLGHRFDKVTPQALLHASGKLLKMYKENLPGDDRDSLEFKTLHSADDFVAERIRLDSRTLAAKVKGRSLSKTTLREIMPSGGFTSGVKTFLTTSQLASIPTHINPMEHVDHAMRVTSLGEGGITNERAIPDEARTVHSTHLGILDPIRTSESFRAGVDIRAALSAHRDVAGNLYAEVIDVKTGRPTHLSAPEMKRAVVAFANQNLKSGTVDAMARGVVSKVPASTVTHYILDASQLYSPATNLVPLLGSLQGNRGIMGGKHVTQALPLVDREAPLVQVGVGPHQDGISRHSFEAILAKQTLPTAPVSGKVVKVDGQHIYIRPDTAKHGEDEGYVETRDVPPAGKSEVNPAPVSTDETPRPRYSVPGVADAMVPDAAPLTGKYAGEVKRTKTVGGLQLKLELLPGDVRSGTSPEGKAWTKEMTAAYGYVPKTRGADGEAVDVYVNPSLLETHGAAEQAPLLGHVYVVHQQKKEGGFDEDKVMVGWPTEAQALEVYKQHGPPWGLAETDGVTALSWDDFVDDYLTQYAKTPAVKTAADAGALVKVPYDTHLPFASKTYSHHDVKVKAGDTVHAGQHLAESNYTKDGHLALGRNLNVAYVPYYGLNSNDAVVISENAAKKLTSEHMYKETWESDGVSKLSRAKHAQYFGSKYTREQLSHLDSDGVVTKGAKVMPHDVLMAGVTQRQLTGSDKLLSNFRKSLVHPYAEVVITWEHDFPGEVIDVYKTENRALVTVKTAEPMRVGDKLSARFGNKGVVAKIVPQNQMLHRDDGAPVDMLFTSASIVSRINPAQLTEVALGKVAQKTGKHINVAPFSEKDHVQWAEDLMKKHDVKLKETLTDPVSGKKLHNVTVGPTYTLRLFKTTETNYAARDTGGYDVNQQPGKGGEDGAKALGKMEFDALVAHNARNVLKESATIKSQRSDEFWRAAQLGLPLPQPRQAFVYDKFHAMLRGAGINPETRGSTVVLKPLTDKDVLKLSSGAIANEKLVRSKDLMPESGGLFDPGLTGGTSGTRWSHINLAEPIVNPIFADPARRLLGMTGKEFDALHLTKGGGAVKQQLNALDVEKEIRGIRQGIPTLKGAKLDDAVKRLKFLEALKKHDLKPGDAYVLSKLPVLPPVMRPILPGQGAQELVVGDANYLYQQAVLHNQALGRQVDSKLLPPKEHEQLRSNLFNAVGAVMGTEETDNAKLQKRGVKGFMTYLTGKTTPKSSFVQQKLLKRQQDLSGRATAVPDATLGMDEVGVPEDQLWTMFGKFVIARLVRQGFGAVQAKEMLEKRHPVAKDALHAEVKERPVIINRAPTLHRYGIIGAFAKPITGKNIAVNPFIEEGQNLDFDGDALQIHVPVTKPAVDDVKRMTLSNLLFADKQKDRLMVTPRMEAMLGIHLASDAKSSGAAKHFKTKEEAMAAYRRGEITLNTPVKVG